MCLSPTAAFLAALLLICFSSAHVYGWHVDRVNLTWASPHAEGGGGSRFMTFCFVEPVAPSIAHIFTDVIVIAETTTRGVTFPWHAVKVRSRDDFHGHVERWLRRAVAGETNAADDEEQLASASFLRDVVSSCPSPFVSGNASACALTVSPFAEACVTVAPGAATLPVRVTLGRQQINWRYPVSLALGLLLIWMGSELAKSKVFQYGVCATGFIVVGAFVLGVYAGKQVMFPPPSSSRRPHSLAITGVATLLTGSYGFTLVWLARTYLRHALLQHWELFMVYVAVAAGAGLAFVRTMRSFGESKHILRISVKWLLRLVGVVLTFNASSSPFVSLLLMGLLFGGYAVYEATKNVARNAASKSKKAR